MARIYQITEEEMNSLIDSLRLARLLESHLNWRVKDEPPTTEDIHRAFHMIVVRWAQAVGFTGVRGVSN